MEARTEKRSKAKSGHAADAAKPKLTASQRESLKLREPFVEMIRRGKDEREAELFSAISQIAFDLHAGDDPEAPCFFAGNLSPMRQAELNSILWNADQAVAWLKEISSGCCWIVNPVVNEFMAEFALDRFNLDRSLRKIDALLSRRPRLRADLYRLPEQVADRWKILHLIIGFCLGMHAYQRSLSRYLDKAALDACERTTFGIRGWIKRNQDGAKKTNGNGKGQ